MSEDLNPEELEQMDWDTLYNLRKTYTGNQRMQDLLSKYEHQAYAREDVAQSPSRALFHAAAIPGYNLYKNVTGAGRSAPSAGQITQGYKGIYQGLLEAMSKRYGI